MLGIGRSLWAAIAAAWSALAGWADRLANRQRFFRRAALVWAVWIISVTVLRATEPGTLAQITTAGASVVIAVVGILATVIGFYERNRSQEDQ